MSSIGRLVNGVAAPYNFAILEVYKEAWHKVKGFKAVLWGGFIIYVLIAIALLLLTKLVGFLSLTAFGENSTQSIVAVANGIVTLAKYPLYAGLLMMGIKHVASQTVRSSMVIDYYRKMWHIIGAGVVAVVVVCIFAILSAVLLGLAKGEMGAVLRCIYSLLGGVFAVISIYLVLCYKFVLALAAEKDMGIWHTLEVSRKAVTQHWFKIFFTVVGWMIIVLISCIPAFLGLIWTLPWSYCIYGVLYRTIFGVEPPSTTIH